jgi:hypothetical protein
MLPELADSAPFEWELGTDALFAVDRTHRIKHAVGLFYRDRSLKLIGYPR